MVKQFVLAAVLAALAGCGDDSEDASVAPISNLPLEASASMAINTWTGPVLEITGGGAVQVTITCDIAILAYAAPDTLQMNASFSGAGAARTETTRQWDLDTVSGQFVSFITTIDLSGSGPWSIQPQIFIGNPMNTASFSNIKARLTRT